MRRLDVSDSVTAKIDLFDFSEGMRGDVDGKLAPPTVPEDCFNFSFSDGALKDAEGIQELELPIGGESVRPKLGEGLTPKKCFYYKRYDYILQKEDDRLLVLTDDGYIYECKIFSAIDFVKLSDLSFTDTPNAVCYKYNGDDVIIFSSGASFKIYNGETVTTVDGVPEVTSMCMHSERLFVTTGGEQTSLWFSDDFDPTNFYISLDQAGFIDFQDSRGRLLKAISFNNYVYLFRNYGITKLSAFGDQTEFYASGLFLGSGRIYKNAIVDCGNRIIYLAEDGFYSFDGIYATRILKQFDKYLTGVDNSDASGKFFNGKLYLTLKLKINKAIKSVLFVYDTASGSAYYVSGLKIKDIETISANGFSKLLMLSEKSNKIGMLIGSARCFNAPLKKSWKSNFSDFGIEQEKTLIKMSLYSLGEAEIIVKSDKGECSKKINGLPTRQTVYFRVKGNTFSVEIKSRAINAEISKIKLYFNYFKE